MGVFLNRIEPKPIGEWVGLKAIVRGKRPERL